MADLKYGENHISTITQLCGNGLWQLNESEQDKPQVSTICIDNDLDFNNEDFYYYDDDFLNIEIPHSAWISGIVFDGQNHTLTNIYLLSSKSFFNITCANINYCDIPLTIKNTTFEAVLGSFSRLFYLDFAHRSIVTFRNCIFNIKTISDLDYIFNKNNSANKNYYMQFINCIFNIECSLFNNFTIAISRSTYACVKIESCEFRLKIIKANAGHSITLAYNSISGNNNDNLSNFNNSLIFVNNYSNELVTVILYHDTNVNSNTSLIKSLVNNFVSAFDGVSASNNKVELDLEISKGSSLTITSSLFIDTDCVSISSQLQELADTTYPVLVNLIPLTTAESKSSTKMAEKGYVFAQE